MVLVSLALVACGPGDELRAGTPATKATESPRQTVPVRRGSIAEVVKGTGRVTSLNETPAYFRVAGRVRTVNVEVGQPVRRGEVVAELEAGQIGVQVEIAKVNLQIAELRSAQAAETSGDSSVQVAAATVAKAQAEHARAIAELETRRAAAGGDVRVWDAAVASARARLTVATLPSQPADIAAAEQAVVSARAAISKAETDLEKTRAGYTPEEIRTQEHALAAAKDVVYAAQVERDAARGRADGAGTAAGDARIAGAQASVDAAADRLRAMKAGGKPEDIAVAEKSVDAARATLGAAEAKLLVIRSGPRPEDVAIAQGSVDEAAARAEQARTTLAGIPSSIDAATAAVDAAAAGVDVARAQYRQRLTEVKAAGGKAVETAIAEKQLDIARLNLQALEQQVEDARIRAPFDGVIGQLAVKPGEQVLAYAPVGTFADPSKLGVSLDVPASDISKVTLGQDATLTLDALGGKTVSEKVVNVPTGLVGVGLPSAGPGETRPVRISLTQPPPGFGIGVAVGVTITTRQKDSALIIPAVAVKRFGGRRLVQVVGADGRRRDVEVETGITTDTDVEITDGLTEGQVVVAS
jgi:RND family efflux transporter MFP subunit